MDESHVAQAMKALGTDYMLISGCSAGCANGKGYDYIASKPWAKYNDVSFRFVLLLMLPAIRFCCPCV
jgi:hypothetical protein